MSGGDFTAKEFRTWNATVLAAVALAGMEEHAKSRTARQRAVSSAVKTVAAYLGNTPTVCRASYIDPRVIDRYHSASTIAPTLRRMPNGPDLADVRTRARIEAAVLELLAEGCEVHKLDRAWRGVVGSFSPCSSVPCDDSPVAGPSRAWVPHLRSAGALLVVIALALSACGSGSSSTSGHNSRPSSTTSSSSPSTAGGAVTRGSGVPVSAVTVIEGWADALRAGHSRRAAAYWAHPSVMVNGPDSAGHFTLIRIRTARDALIADETLSCGATLRRTSSIGAYVQADFTLSTRTGAGASSSGCSGPAHVNFLIRDSHIVRWLRAPITSSPPQGGGGGQGESGGKGAGSLSI